MLNASNVSQLTGQKQPDICQLKYLIKHSVALILQVDSIEQCSDV